MPRFVAIKFSAKSKNQLTHFNAEAHFNSTERYFAKQRPVMVTVILAVFDGVGGQAATNDDEIGGKFHFSIVKGSGE